MNTVFLRKFFHRDPSIAPRRGRVSGIFVHWGRGSMGLVSFWFTLLLCAFLVAVQILDPAPRQKIRNLAFDWAQRHAPWVGSDAVPVRVVAIDEESLKQLGQWPWPRTRLALLVDRLRDLGARVVVLDLLLAEPDRTSPAALAALWPDHPEWGATLARMPDHDQLLADSMARIPTVLSFALDDRSATSLPMEKARFPALGGHPQERLPRFVGTVAALPLLQNAALGNGIISRVGSDPDGVLRHLSLICRVGSGIYPVLGLEALRVYEGQSNVMLLTDMSGFVNPALRGLGLGQSFYPTAPDGQIWLHYRPFQPQRYLSVRTVLDGKVDAALIKDHIIFVGATAQGLGDDVVTPLGEMVPGVELHTQLLEQLYTQSYLLHPAWESDIVVGLLLASWLFARQLLNRSRIRWMVAINGVLAVLLVLLALWLLESARLFFDPLYPILAMALLSAGFLVPHLYRLEKERQMVQAKSRFIANVTHELRTPMSAILGLTGLCLQTELTSRQRDYLTKVRTAGETLLGLINDLLDISKMEADRLSLELVPYQLDQVLGHLAVMTQLKAREKGLRLLIHRDPAIPENLRGDPLRLGQVLINLVNNAIKFTPAGEVSITMRLASRSRQGVVLEGVVKDSGIGISAAQQLRLFQAFVQADGSTSREYGGTGLGLAICRQLVNMMGGTIHLESAPGQGSTFTFTLTQTLDATRSEFLAIPREWRGMRVLVADGCAATRGQLIEYLAAWHCQSLAVDSGAAALGAINAAGDPWALLLIDWELADMKGLEAAQRLRAALAGSAFAPKLLLLTPLLEALPPSGELAVVDGVLTQPVLPSSLLQGILELYARGAATAAGMALESRPEPDVMDPVWRLRGARVLVVEDNPLNRQIATELLHQVGVEVEVARDGLEAAQRMEAGGGFDAILMDMQMPVMDGPMAVRRIRADARFARHPPILALTAQEENSRLIQEVGMDGFVAKPIEPRTLYAALAAHMVPRAGFSGPEPLSATSAVALPVPSQAVPASEVTLPESLPGMRCADALARLGGNRALLRSLLEGFRERHGDDSKELRAALQQGDLTLAHRKAHTLKGIAGSFGLLAVRSAAEALENALDGRLVRRQAGMEWEAASLQRLVDELERALTPFQVALGAWVDAEATRRATDSPLTGHGVADPVALALQLDELEEMMRQLDPKAVDKIAELLHNLPSEARAAASVLLRRVKMFDFDEALESLRELRVNLRTPEETVPSHPTPSHPKAT
ncbi:MAG: CHASE2 domain-containing protein [Magnetococcales bacterium]|nr:CHASE2 domain-containing protein [Magnetococcales bacterium]